MRIAHFPFDFGAGRESGDRVDHNHVKRITAHQGVYDFKGLLARIWLGDQEVSSVNSQSSGVGAVKRMFGIYKSRVTTRSLRAGDDVQAKGGFTRRLRAINLCDAPAWDASNAQGEVEGNRSGRDHFHLNLGDIA